MFNPAMRGTNHRLLDRKIAWDWQKPYVFTSERPVARSSMSAGRRHRFGWQEILHSARKYFKENF